MQVPEKLALIGGSILLSSTLIFTLKSQASSIIPHVSHTIGDVYQSITDMQAQHGTLSFSEAYQRAQKSGWQTGQWGTARFYVDNQGNMHIGKGALQNTFGLRSAVGNNTAASLRTITFDGPVQALSDICLIITIVYKHLICKISIVLMPIWRLF